MEQTECSETSAYKLQTPGNYLKESIKQTTELFGVNQINQHNGQKNDFPGKKNRHKSCFSLKLVSKAIPRGIVHKCTVFNECLFPLVSIHNTTECRVLKTSRQNISNICHLTKSGKMKIRACKIARGSTLAPLENMEMEEINCKEMVKTEHNKRGTGK